MLLEVGTALSDPGGDHVAIELGEGGKHVSKEAALRAENQLGLKDEMLIHACLVKLVKVHDGIEHAACHPAQRHGVDPVDAAEVDDLAQLTHGRSIECYAGLSLVIETLSAPAKAVDH